jgi:hypothetical protein
MLADDYTFRAPPSYRGFGQDTSAADFMTLESGATAAASRTTQGASWWDAVGGALNQVIQAGGQYAASALRKAGGISTAPAKPPTQAGIAGISMNTLLLVGGLGLAAVVVLPRLMRKGRRR